MTSGPITSWQIEGGKEWHFIFLGSKISADSKCSHGIKRCSLLWRKTMTNLDSILKSRHCFASKDPSSQNYGFSSSHVWMWELDHNEGQEPKNWCFWTVVLEKTLKSPLDSNEIKPVNSKGTQSWTFLGRTDAEAVILWPRDVKSWLIRKDSVAGEDWGQKEKGVTEDEMIGWHHWLNGHEFDQTPGDIERQRSLECCNPWGCKESDMT